jgi:hypothetical protein
MFSRAAGGSHAGRVTVVMCVGLSRDRVTTAREDVTRVVGLDSIDDAPPDASLILSLSPDQLASRQAVRSTIAAARSRRPDLGAVRARDVARVTAHELVDAGIRIVLVDEFLEGQRGSRRPAPAGWACRQPVWGLWEVQVVRGPTPIGWRRLLKRSPAKTTREGGLVVLCPPVSVGNTDASAGVQDPDAWWTQAFGPARQADASYLTVPQLSSLLDRGGDATAARSVLQAA